MKLMHRALKAETARSPAANRRPQLARYDRFREEYTIRPFAQTILVHVRLDQSGDGEAQLPKNDKGPPL